MIIVIVIVVLLFVVLVLYGPTRQMLERRRVDAIVNDRGDKHKEPAGGARDSRNQGTKSTGSDFEKSDLSSSGRSGFSREGRALTDNKAASAGKAVLLDRPSRYTMRQTESAEHQAHLVLMAARIRLDEAKKEYHGSSSVAARNRLRMLHHAVNDAEKAYEAARSQHNKVLVNHRKNRIYVDGRLRTGTAHIIGEQVPC